MGQYSYTADFGLMFYNARWYDPSLGRFAQADSIVPGGVQGLDRYAYVNNNPVRYTDPSGHACVEGTSYCVNSSTGQTSGSLTSYNDSSNLSARLDGKVENNPSEEVDDDYAASQVKNENIRNSLNSDDVFVKQFTPFTMNFQPCQVDTNGRCRVAPQKYRLVYSFYLTQEQQSQLAWDIFGLGASLVGVKEIQSAIMLPEVVGRYVSQFVTGVSIADSVTNRDLVGGVITAAGGAEPHVAVGSSIILIGRDLSGGWGKTLVSNRQLLIGPPAGPFCDGRYGC